VELEKHSDYKRFLDMYGKALKSEGVSEEQRRSIMCSVNPCYVLRNWIAQKSIVEAEEGDFNLVKLIEKILRNPYQRQEEAEKLGFSGKPPNWEKGLKVSCSS